MAAISKAAKVSTTRSHSNCKATVDVCGKRGVLYRTRGAWPVILLLAISFPASCEKNADGPLGPFLDIGARGAWIGSIDGGVYKLVNDSDERALRMITIERTEDSFFEASVDLAIGTGSGGAAGLVLGHDPAAKKFYLLTVDAKGDVTLTRGAGEAHKVVLRKSTTLKPGFNRLAFSGHDHEVDIVLNDAQIGHYAANDLDEGEAGIVARGTGAFSFANFAASGYAGSRE